MHAKWVLLVALVALAGFAAAMPSTDGQDVAVSGPADEVSLEGMDLDDVEVSENADDELSESAAAEEAEEAAGDESADVEESDDEDVEDIDADESDDASESPYHALQRKFENSEDDSQVRFSNVLKLLKAEREHKKKLNEDAEPGYVRGAARCARQPRHPSCANTGRYARAIKKYHRRGNRSMKAVARKWDHRRDALDRRYKHMYNRYLKTLKRFFQKKFNIMARRYVKEHKTVKGLKKAVWALVAKLASSNHMIQRLRQNLVALRAKLHHARKWADKLQAQVNALKVKLAAARAALRKLQREHNAQLGRHKALLAKHHILHQQYKALVIRAAANLARANARIKKITDQINKANARTAALNQAIRDCHSNTANTITRMKAEIVKAKAGWQTRVFNRGCERCQCRPNGTGRTCTCAVTAAHRRWQNQQQGAAWMSCSQNRAACWGGGRNVVRCGFRPSGKCGRSRSCVRIRGDVHMTTIDGCHYETLGLGDYTMMQGNSTIVQARFRQIGQGTDTQAVAVQEAKHKVEVVGPTTKGGTSAVLVDGKAVADCNPKPCVQFQKDGVQVERELREGAKFTIVKTPTIILTIRSHPTLDLINMAYEVSPRVKGRVTGLWGNFNEQQCDAKMNLWENQVKFRLPPGKSLFTDQSYKPDLSFRSPSTPQFKDKQSEEKARKFCVEKHKATSSNGYRVCMYDMAETGNERVAGDERDGVRAAQMAADQEPDFANNGAAPPKEVLATADIDAENDAPGSLKQRLVWVFPKKVEVPTVGDEEDEAAASEPAPALDAEDVEESTDAADSDDEEEDVETPEEEEEETADAPADEDESLDASDDLEEDEDEDDESDE